MFSALRQNSTIFILEKKDSPVLKRGVIESVSAPRSKTGSYYGQLDTVVDIRVRVDEMVTEYKDIPANLSIANDGNIVLSETKEAMSTEVDSMLAVSRQILNSVPYHQNVVDACEGMMKELNPQFAKELEQQEKINLLESRMGGIESSMNDMKSMLSEALDRLTK